MDISPISTMPKLSKRIGKSGAARIRAGMLDDSNYRKNRSQFDNTILTNMQLRKPSDMGPISDLIHGAANTASTGNKPLNESCIYVLLQCLDVICTRRVMNVLEVSERQAQKYVKACRTLLPQLEKQFNQEEPYVPDITYH